MRSHAPLTHLEAHPPETPDSATGRRTEALRTELDETAELLGEASQLAESLDEVLRQSPSQDRQVRVQRDARAILGDVARLRRMLLEAELTLLDGPRLQQAQITLDEIHGLPDIAVPTREEADLRHDALDALQRQLRESRTPPSEHYATFDALHDALDRADASARATLREIDREIERRNTPVDRAFAAQRATIDDLTRAALAWEPRMAQLADQASELGDSARQRNQALQRSIAAAGIVDASWLRLQQSREAQATAQEEHRAALERLDDSFRRMRARLTMADDATP